MRKSRSCGSAASLGSALLAGSGADAAADRRAQTALAPPPVVTGIDAGGGPWLVAYEPDRRWQLGLLACFDFGLGGLNVAAGDVDGDGRARGRGVCLRGERQACTPRGRRLKHPPTGG